MNIRQAKEHIRHTVKLYLKKDEFGEYRIPTVRQRPVFLCGAPGIGKTAIMEQIAQELGIALVSYSMTHHTRQSALGLPVIRHKEYEGKEYDVSEYTMSEIIGAVYDVMKASGMKEGILFLDEINCVSETLAPSMLQFLQYKVFGKHSMPQGWVIVTAGNPREYNRSAREFDVVTLDRLKVIDVEADYDSWKAYAVSRGIHQAITNYLEMKTQDFYLTEMTEKGRVYVTARGWEDLSQIIRLYEEEGLPVTEEVTAQYIRHERIVREFTAYYDLFCKYKKDYHADEILNGKASAEMKEKASAAPFDERLSLLGMLTERADAMMRECMERTDALASILDALRVVKSKAQSAGLGDEAQGADLSSGKRQSTDAGDGAAMVVAHAMQTQAQARRSLLDSLEAANALSGEDKRMQLRVIRFLEEQKRQVTLSDASSPSQQFALVKRAFDEAAQKSRQDTQYVKECLHHLFVFVEEALAGENEMLLLVTHMTVTDCCAGFVARFGCEDYKERCAQMMISERQNSLMKQIGELEL